MDSDYNKVETTNTITSKAKKISTMARKNNTPYDDVFRTLLNDCKQLLLPVLNEVFGEKYTGNETIVYSKNEHFLNMQDGVEDKRVTDSAFTVIGEKARNFIFECQSTPDSSMLVRLFELEELEDNSEKLAALEREYETIVERLNELTEQKKLSAYYRMTILEMSNKVVESLAARYEKIVKGVKEIMGGTILNYKAKDILREGAMEEKKETAFTLQEMGMPVDNIAQALRVSIEQVKEWLSLTLA